MGIHTIRKGLDLPITGAPKQEIHDGPAVGHVALMAADFPYMKPKMLVKAGDKVKRGQPLFDDRKANSVRFTAPAAGTVTAVNRGAKRALISVVIAVDEERRRIRQPHLRAYSADAGSTRRRCAPCSTSPECGLRSGPASRSRPIFGRGVLEHLRHVHRYTPTGSRPTGRAGGREEDFVAGLGSARPPDRRPCASVQGARCRTFPTGDISKVTVAEFKGKHPAGLVGTHIHALDAVSRSKTVWHIDAQDVAAIGHLFRTGTLDVSRVISLGGPMVKSPRLIKTRHRRQCPGDHRR